MTPTAANIAEDSTSSNLAWCTEGRSDFFTREAILGCAPSTSGVYGLFNSDCQLFIGESANIQEALLRHQNESEFHSRHLQPTGFTFEPCAEELRKSKAAEMIAKYRPVLQAEAALSEVYLLSDDLVVDEPDVGDESLLAAEGEQFPDHEHDERPKARRSLPIKGMLTVVLVSALIASALAIFYFGVPGDYRIHTQANGANLTLARAETGWQSQNTRSIDAANNTAIASAKTTPGKRATPVLTAPSGDAAGAAAKRTQGADEPTAQAKANPPAPNVDGVKTAKKWSVQISAAPAKDIANNLIERLKADGYDGYVVPAEVNGKTFFRVRVGPFDGREEAESARQSLAQQASYRDAYLTAD